jgi:hypothetical protein
MGATTRMSRFFWSAVLSTITVRPMLGRSSAMTEPSPTKTRRTGVAAVSLGEPASHRQRGTHAVASVYSGKNRSARRFMAALALMRADGRAVRDVVITLVHGTWPRNIWRDALLTPFYGRWPNGYFPKNLWFADGSEFRNRLTAALSQHGLSAQVSAFL